MIGKNNSIRRMLFVITILILGLIITVSSFAWYQAGNVKNTEIAIQAYNKYVLTVENGNAEEILTATQSNGSGSLFTIEGGAEGTLYYVSIPVEYTVENAPGPQKIKFEVTDIIVKVKNANNEEIEQDTPVSRALKSQLIFQFSKADGGASVYAGIDANGELTGARDITPTLVEGDWKTITKSEDPDNPSVYPTAYIESGNTTDGKITLNVAFNVVDDELDPGYIGLKLSFVVTMTAVDTTTPTT